MECYDFCIIGWKYTEGTNSWPHVYNTLNVRVHRGWGMAKTLTREQGLHYLKMCNYMYVTPFGLLNEWVLKLTSCKSMKHNLATMLALLLGQYCNLVQACVQMVEINLCRRKFILHLATIWCIQGCLLYTVWWANQWIVYVSIVPPECNNVSHLHTLENLLQSVHTPKK